MATPKLPELLPVVNRDVRVYRISRYRPRESEDAVEGCPTDTQKLTPGLCFVSPDRFDDVKALCASSGGAVDFVTDLKQLNPAQRTELIDLTTDPYALKIWKTYVSNNKEIRGQLNARLRAMGVDTN